MSDVLDRFYLPAGECVRRAYPEELYVVMGLCLEAVQDHGSESAAVNRDPAAMVELRDLVAVHTSGKHPHLVALVLDIGGMAVGYTLVEISDLPWVDGPVTAEVNGMYIQPQWRSGRRSMALLRAIRDWARETGAQRVQWRTHHLDKSIFERLGQAAQTIYRMEV